MRCHGSFGLAALVSALGGCTAPGVALVHRADGWSVEHSAFLIAPDAGGQLMPLAWTLENYDERGGVLRKRTPDSPDLLFRRTGSSLIVTSEPILSEDESAPLTAIAKKSMSNLASTTARNRWFGLGPGLDPRYEQYDRFSGKPVDAVFPPLTERVAPMFRSVVPPALVAVPGAEAIEATFDQVRPGASEIIQRLYVVWLRSRARPVLTMLVYAAPPKAFDDGLADAKGLLRRLVIP